MITYLCECGFEFWDEGEDSQDTATCERCGAEAGAMP